MVPKDAQYYFRAPLLFLFVMQLAKLAGKTAVSGQFTPAVDAADNSTFGLKL